MRNTGLDRRGIGGASGTLEDAALVGRRNDLGWEIYPEGLGHLLHAFRRWDLSLLITENGIPTSDEDDRWSFEFLHLWQVMRAMNGCVPVAGCL